MFWLVITIVALGVFYCKIKQAHSYWAKQGIPQTKPVFLFGDAWTTITRQLSAPELTEYVYKMSPNTRYIGMYQFTIPNLFIRDPDLIKQIGVKDFDHFTDHKGFVSPEADPLLGKTLFSLTGKTWREMRSTLSPAFTSSKMKYMFNLISESGQQCVQHFAKQDKDIIKVEMRDIVSRFANDVIANTIFGFKCDSLNEPKNEFFIKGQEAADFTNIRKIVVFLGYVALPGLCKFLKLTLFSDAMTKYFTTIIKENIESREKHGFTRPDMINLLLEARKNNWKQEDNDSLPDTGFATVEESEIGKDKKIRKREITDDDITSQAFIFFFAGFDSVSSLISFMCYELAVNPDVQEKLTQEVDATRQKCSGKITYEALTTMKYLDMVLSETLRKWPNGIATDRICTKPYTIEPKLPGEKPVHLKLGDTVHLPMYAIHRDPQYYPDPERFDPERFSDENKHKILPYTFFPFGVGPRSCIASRFAILESKIFIYHVLSQFELEPTEKTQIPLRFNRKAINMSAEKGFWLGLKNRNLQ